MQAQIPLLCDNEVLPVPRHCRRLIQLSRLTAYTADEAKKFAVRIQLQNLILLPAQHIEMLTVRADRFRAVLAQLRHGFQRPFWIFQHTAVEKFQRAAIRIL